jgi:arylsulfatase A-like enzyme
MISVDDLRPVGQAFGQPHIFAPNMDRLASGGTAFQRAYAQYAVCNPSRASLLTGLRPDSTKIYDLNTHFRMHIPDVVTLPQHFKNNGYATTGIGKFYHLPFDDPKSWSIPSWSPERAIEYRNRELRSKLEAANPDGTEDIVTEHDHHDGTIMRAESRKRVRGPAWEIAHDDLEGLPDAQIADRAIAQLDAMKDGPFFLGVGFKKPHLPFVAPGKFFDLYPADRVKLAINAFRPLGLPPYEAHKAELPAYDGIPDDLDLSEAERRALVRGYAAATSYVDYEIGRVLNALDTLGMRDSTIVVLFGDHGYFLGENGFWAKHNNMEVATRAPLIMRVPGQSMTGARPMHFAELVDIFPTLIDLAGLPKEIGLEGTSLVPALMAGKPVKRAAFSQYRRNKAMGYSVRTDTHRFTEWRDDASGEVKAHVLFDHRIDPQENRNIADQPDQLAIVKTMSEMVAKGWKGARI